jgi:hypothetical protein
MAGISAISSPILPRSWPPSWRLPKRSSHEFYPRAARRAPPRNMNKASYMQEHPIGGFRGQHAFIWNQISGPGHQSPASW